MHAQYEPAAMAVAPLLFEAPYEIELPPLRDFQARLHAAGPLSDDDYRLLMEHHRWASRLELRRIPVPGIAEHVLPEAWRTGA